MGLHDRFKSYGPVDFFLENGDILPKMPCSVKYKTFVYAPTQVQNTVNDRFLEG